MIFFIRFTMFFLQFSIHNTSTHVVTSSHLLYVIVIFIKSTVRILNPTVTPQPVIIITYRLSVIGIRKVIILFKNMNDIETIN